MADNDLGLGSGLFLQQASILGSEHKVVPSNTSVRAVELKGAHMGARCTKS